MRFGILGPLEVSDEGRAIALAGAKQRSLLAILLLHRNEVVSADRLIDDLWGERPPETAQKALQVYVSQLRRALDPDRLLTQPPGYLLRVESGELDLERVERLLEDARRLDAYGKARPLREALDLWRGPALADFQYEPFAQGEIARLAELRLSALEDRIAADLARGRHAELIGELEALVAAEPLRERLRAQLMLALYRSGRQADALTAYREARRTLVEEVGIEPSRELAELEQAVLRQDRSLDVAMAAAGDGAPPGSVFVGRERELADLLRPLEGALDGRGGLCLIAGEPGIGKSRLADELGKHARERGAKVLWGRCWEAGGAPAYWPWVQSLRAYVRERDPALLRPELGPGAEQLAGLLPDLGTILPDLSAPPPAEDEGARFRLFDATAGFLRAAAAAQPLVIVLDDIHVADTPSLLLLQFVAGELRSASVLVVATYRDVAPVPGERLTAILAELRRGQATHHVVLGGLSERDVGRFIELSTPTSPPARLTAAIHAETEGNPLFVAETVRLLAAEGQLEDAPLETIAIPQSVRHVIRRRLAQLPPECSDLLATASVLGREFEVDALDRMNARPRDDLLALLDEAVAARVLAETPGARGRLRFAHALIRDTLYDELGSGRRARLHREAGEALEGLYAADLDPHLSELAYHFGAAGPGEAGAQALDYAWRAGDGAVRLLAYEEAARLYAMALGVLERERPNDLAARCELLLALADGQGRAGDGSGAKSTFLRAADLARSAALPEPLARAAVSYGGRFVWHRAASDDRLVPLLEEALSALGDRDTVLRVQLLSRLAAALRGEPSRERRARLCEEAIQTARGLGEPAVIAYALDAAEAALHGPDAVERVLAEAAEIVSLALTTGDRERLFDGHEHAFWAAWELGDPDRRDAELAAFTRVAEELRQPAQLWMATTAGAVLALAEGRFDEAEQLIGESATLGERALSWSAAATRRVQEFILRRQQGRFDGLEAEVRESAHEFASPLLHRSVLAYVCARSERGAEAAAILDELSRHDLSDWHVDEEWLFSICLLAETCALVASTEHAGPLYELLLPYGSLNAIAVPEGTLDSTCRPLGILAALLGRFDDAERHFEGALRMNDRMGARPWVAQAQDEYARMLVRRDAPGDRRRARELLEAAVATYRQLGMDSYAAPALQAGQSVSSTRSMR